MFLKEKKMPRGFTLIEILIVVVIVGLTAGLGLANYTKSLERAYVQDAMSQLRMIHRAQKMYFIKYKEYYPPTADAANKDLLQINAALNLGINANKVTYTCRHGGGSAVFTCDAVRTGGAWTVTVTQNDLSGSNPVCSGTCP